LHISQTKLGLELFRLDFAAMLGAGGDPAADGFVNPYSRKGAAQKTEVATVVRCGER